jgi:uncharacterized alkaline shock family protein YloU
MRFFTVIGVIFYTTVLFIIAGILIVFALNWLPTNDIIQVIGYIQLSPNSRIITGLMGILLILISISFAQLILGRLQKEKTIAFSNPTGQVTISLSAVEDLIKRITSGIHEIREVRPDVIATKRGINISLRLILRSEANIPDLTSQLQDMVRSKVQEILGIEEPITVKIHVAKIITSEEREKKRKETEKDNPSIPFSGYGRL